MLYTTRSDWAVRCAGTVAPTPQQHNHLGKGSHAHHRISDSLGRARTFALLTDLQVKLMPILKVRLKFGGLVLSSTGDCKAESELSQTSPAFLPSRENDLTLILSAPDFLVLFGSAPCLLENRASLHEESQPTARVQYPVAKSFHFWLPHSVKGLC